MCNNDNECSLLLGQFNKQRTLLSETNHLNQQSKPWNVSVKYKLIYRLQMHIRYLMYIKTHSHQICRLHYTVIVALRDFVFSAKWYEGIYIYIENKKQLKYNIMAINVVFNPESYNSVQNNFNAVLIADDVVSLMWNVNFMSYKLYLWNNRYR